MRTNTSEQKRGFRLPKPSLAFLGIFVIIVALVAGAGFALGLGRASILAGLIGLLLFLAAFGGTLRTDLTILASLALALVVFVVIPAFIMPTLPWISVLFVLVAVFIAGLLPALGKRYVSVGLVIGMVAVFAHAYQYAGSASAPQIAAGALLAFGIVTVLRLVASLGNPNAALHSALADLMTSPSPTTATAAITTWVAGPAQVWTGTVLLAGLRYTMAMQTLGYRSTRVESARANQIDAFVQQLTLRAAIIATRMRAKTGASTTQEAGDGEVSPNEAGLTQLLDQLHPLDQAFGRSAVDELALIDHAATTRDTTRVDGIAQLHRAFLRNAARVALSLEAERCRHALRVVLAVGITLVIAHLLPASTFTSGFIMGPYAVLQPSWEDSFSQARQRIIGVVVGALLTALLVWLLPPTLTLIVGLLAFIVGMAYIATSRSFFMACLVIMLTMAVAPSLHLTPSVYLVGYVATTVVGALIALAVGFTVVPGLSHPSRERLLQRAVNATRELLETLAAPAPVASHQRIADAIRAQQNTVPTTQNRAGSATVNRFVEASSALAMINFVCLAVTLGIAGPSARVTDSLALAARNLKAMETGELDATAESVNVLDAPDLFTNILLIETERLQTASRLNA